MPILNGAIDSMQEGEDLDYEGDLNINCSIPPGAKIRVKNGSLTVNGDVGEGAIISLETTPIIMDKANSTGDSSITVSGSSLSNVVIGNNNVVYNGSTIGDGNVVFNDNINVSGNFVFKGVHVTVGAAPMIFSTDGSSFAQSHNLIINGNVKDGAEITAHTAVSCWNVSEHCVINAKGNIMCHDVGAETIVKTNNFNITAANIHESANLETRNGSIKTANVLSGAILKTINGSIRVGNIAGDAVLTTSHGSIDAEDIADGAVLSTVNGSIKARYVKGNAKLTTRMGSITVESANNPSNLSTTLGVISIGGIPQQRGRGSRRKMDLC